MQRTVAARSPRETRLHWALIGAGLCLIAAASVFQVAKWTWMSRYHRVGTALVQQESAAINGAIDGSARLSNTKAATPASLTGCATRPTTGPQALLEIPALGVTAPIEQGSSDAVLAVAVGHDPYSVWPGTNGTSVLLSHDVTYFVNIGHLRPGQMASYVTPCATYLYKVTGNKIVVAGSPIYNSPYSTIALVTCFPSNALFYTNQRQVVTLSLVKTTSNKTPTTIAMSADGVPTADAKQPSVPVPAPLFAQGLTLETNYAPMGVLTILGNPNPRYVQSPAPLLAEEAALVAYFGGLKSLAEGHTDWWAKFAPHVRPPGALVGHSVSSYPSSVDVYIEAHNFAITGVAIRDSVLIGGVRHAMQIGMSISKHNVLTITSWNA